MKKTALSLIIGFMLSSSIAIGQSIDDELALYQSIFGMEKKTLVADFISLDEEKAVIFWDIYYEYEAERKLLGKKRVELLMDYADNYQNIDADKTDELVKAIMVQRKALDKSVEKYYKQLRKSVGSTEAAQFYQIEMYILSAIRLSILDAIPFFGE